MFNYKAENGERVSLSINKCQLSGDKRNNTTNCSMIEWYTDGVSKSEGYIDAAFRSSRTNEAYLFMKNEYLLLDYATGSSDDRVLNGPFLIPYGFHSLKGTAFGDYGVDCSFGSDNKYEASIFSGNLCARMNYAPGTTNDRITSGPMTITKMFPFFKNTNFQNGVDAAFESSTPYEAYLFKGDQYALINYKMDNNASPRLIAIRSISRGDSYALINFAPGSTDDSLIGGVKKILPNWTSLQSILPRNNRGIDITGDDEST
uniref:Uncharacterized protein n=1 Tax=Chenopodium quinoa TaxID=63459 RepID=A0A803LLB1_CHEQI